MLKYLSQTVMKKRSGMSELNNSGSLITLPGEVQNGQPVIWSNSANILCNYMRKPEYLHTILSNMAITPRYVEEIIDYWRVPDFFSISFPMTCFCDIPLSKVKSHMDFYGNYGIAFDKNITLSRDIQPITYINTQSRYFEDFSEAFGKLIASENALDQEWDFLPDVILTQLLYSKPIRGIMPKGDDYVEKLFQDECEWRFIPPIPIDKKLVLDASLNTVKGRNAFSEALALEQNQIYWFRFSIDDIVYLIVPNEGEAIKLIEYIQEELGGQLSAMEKNKLISKIEIASQFEKNLV